MLASEGRAFTEAVLDRAAALARSLDASVGVVAIARIWGSAFGFPNPWLMPSRREMDEQRAHVAAAIAGLARRGVEATGRVIGTRHAARRIAAEARIAGYEAILMGADAPPRHRMLADLWWSNEPYAVARRARVPVHLVRPDS